MTGVYGIPKHVGLMSIRGRQAVEGCAPDADDGRSRGIFGGFNLILAGDSMQLSPVGRAAMWAEKPNTTGHTIEGRAVSLGVNVRWANRDNVAAG